MAYFYTPLATRGPLTAQNFNTRFQELDNALLDVMARAGTFLGLPPLSAVGDGVADDSDALEDALGAGGIVIGEPGKTYKIMRSIPIPSNTIFDLNGATILQGDVVGSTGFLAASGTQGSKVDFAVDQPAGSVFVTLPTGQGATGGWAEGDLVMLESDGISIDVPGIDTFSKEMHKVRSVSGDVLTIDGALIWSYNVADTAKYSKVTPVKNIYIHHLRMTNGNNPANIGYSIRTAFVENFNLRDTHLYQCGGGINLHETYGVNIDNIVIEDVVDFSGSLVAYGYGIFPAAASAFIDISNYRAHNLRHAFTTIYEQRAGGTIFYGSPRHITLINCKGDATENVDSTGIWDTHQAGYDVTFINCTATGGKSGTTPGFQLRSPTMLIGCKAIRCGGRGISAADGSEGSQVIGGEFAYNESQGVTSRARFKYKDVWVHHNGASGIGTGGDDCEIDGCTVEENASYGIQPGAGDRLYIRNNKVPYSATQTIAILNAPSGALIENNNFGSGYAGGGALFGLNAGAVARRNTGFVTENSGTGTIASGATSVTISHGCHRTPTVDDIMITFAEQGTNDYGRWWVDTIGSSTFKLNVSADPGASGLDFGWRVEIG